MSTATNNNTASTPRLRVMIVDDSAVMRSVISRTLSPHADIEVVGLANNGEIAVQNVKLLNPDIVILDIEMPVMDGITALPLILKEKPGVRVLICSTLSAQGADVSIKALSLGATECILKPGGETIVSAHDFQENLVRVIRNLGQGIRLKHDISGLASKISLKKSHFTLAPKILAIGSSTGGPNVLMQVLSQLKNLPVPIVITQHMPKTFTSMLAQHITQKTGVSCFEGAEGMAIKPGCAYVAPGGKHMVLKKNGDAVVIAVNEEPPENFCRPSVNPMLRSLPAIYGNKILVAILTGMGNDGSQVCAELAEKGAQIIAQDQASSVVWGMPGAVANAGICSDVLPIDQIAPCIIRAISRGSQ